MILKQLTDQNIPVLLSSPTVLFSDVVLSILKPGDSAWTIIPIITGDWVSVGAGYYSLKLPAAQLNILGPNLLRLSSVSAGFTTITIATDILARTTTEIQPINTCLLFGTVIGVDGKPATDQEIILRIFDLPFSSSASLATTQPSRTRSTGAGYFEVPLLRLSTVMIEIPTAGIRKQFVVPDQSTISLVDALNL